MGRYKGRSLVRCGRGRLTSKERIDLSLSRRVIGTFLVCGTPGLGRSYRLLRMYVKARRFRATSFKDNESMR